jgi:hypothetical protein
LKLHHSFVYTLYFYSPSRPLVACYRVIFTFTLEKECNFIIVLYVYGSSA